MNRAKLLKLYHYLGARLTLLDREADATEVPISTRGDGWSTWFRAWHREYHATLRWRVRVGAMIDDLAGRKQATYQGKPAAEWAGWPKVSEYLDTRIPFDPAIHGPDPTLSSKRLLKRQKRARRRRKRNGSNQS